ncbi:FAD-dependent monooxygenase [Halolamina sp. C58]|uniref:FAD-dependent monooxygenase n=1 Tax=Halolamina sp. C58 TaxID=3421640 RepID=UPI003EB9544D
MGTKRDGTKPGDSASVLIVGGGLAGLTLANYLARQGREPLIVVNVALPSLPEFALGVLGELSQFVGLLCILYGLWTPNGEP